ncbi:MAG: stage II sporulation protein M [Planctomycetota bacterium]|jgi:uncharacterized membrane protein SpoIIM required for sporulation
MDAVQLKSYEFRKEREKTWRRLERLVARVEKSGLHSLGAEELAQLPLLYRATLSSLSVARTISLDQALLEYLESLGARAYFCVYSAKKNLRETLADFFARRLPQTVRRFRWYVALSALILLAGTAVAFVLTVRSPDWFYTFVDEGYQAGRNPAASTATLRGALYDEKDFGSALGSFASFLFTHNARVGMTAFALGFVAGLPVYILLFMNGLILGAFGALYHSRGLGLDWWGWVLPHGVTELFAVILCGAAGLALAHALVFPGRYTRLQNLALRGREAGIVVLGAVVLFFIAGLIEGIFRQMVMDITVRYLVILLTASGLAWYFLRVGRTQP